MEGIYNGKRSLRKKVGMTQIFSEEGKAIPVTAIEVKPLTVVGKKLLTKKDTML